MAYEYDNDNGIRQPQPPKKDSDIGSWIFIAVMFTVAWPIGLILLLIKLSESGNKKEECPPDSGTEWAAHLPAGDGGLAPGRKGPQRRGAGDPHPGLHR